MEISVKAIKNLLKRELSEHKTNAIQALHNAYVPNVQKEFIYIAHSYLENKLATLTTHDELDDFIFECGYRMSLEDWVNSL